jgi:quercetin dioxygenase-like cupin family protein
MGKTPPVVEKDNTCRFEKCNIFEAELLPVCAHNGRGLIRFKRILTGEQIAGSCNFMDVSVIPPGCTIAEHRHALDEEEYYLILKGSGFMSRDGETFQVRSGDLIRNRPGGSHSLVNDSADDIVMFVFEIRVER